MDNDGTTASGGRIGQLDALRAVACLIVLIAHLDSIYGFPELPQESGPVGVAIFFALSGYLITRGLISTPINLFAFFNRRVARILPAYFMTLGVVATFFYGKQLLWCGAFAFNFLFVSGARDYFHVPSHAPPSPPIGHLWSICVEEHFYWFWPLLLSWFSRRAATFLLLTAIIATPLIAWYIIASLDSRGVHPDVFAGIVSRITFTQLTAIAMGSLIALHETSLTLTTSIIGFRVPRILVLGIFAFVVCIALRELFRLRALGTPEQQLCWQPSLVHFFGAAIMAIGLTCRWLGSVPWLNYIGRISYGLYLYHLPIYFYFGLARGDHSQTWIAGGAALASTFVLAMISFRFFEYPLIQWGKNQRKSSQFNVSGVGITLSGLLAICCFGTLYFNCEQQPLSSILNLTPTIPLQERRQELKPTGTATMAYRWLGVEHCADSLGFRRTTPFPPKVHNTIRVLTVGDSFTWGACVSTDKTYSAVLERRLRKSGWQCEVINCGKPGGQAQDALYNIRDQLLELRPDRIIYGATMSDFLPSNEGWDGHTIEEWYLKENQDRFTTALKGISELCDREKIDFSMFVFCQDPSDVNLAKVVRLMEELGFNAGVNVISVASYLDRYHDKDFRILAPFDNHPTAECHKIHGDLIAEHFIVDRPLPR